MKTQHTPGPWKLQLQRWPDGTLNGRPYIYAPNGPDTHRHIAEVFVDGGAPADIQEMQVANGHLIASAPEAYAERDAALLALGDLQSAVAEALNLRATVMSPAKVKLRIQAYITERDALAAEVARLKGQVDELREVLKLVERYYLPTPVMIEIRTAILNTAAGQEVAS